MAFLYNLFIKININKEDVMAKSIVRKEDCFLLRKFSGRYDYRSDFYKYTVVVVLFITFITFMAVYN